MAVKGNALVPLSLYWKNGRVKVSLGVCKGKVEYDKRDDIKKREMDRELKRATMHRLKRK
jgi:SsrA-binding protein